MRIRIYKWRITNPITGKKIVTRHHASEEDIRKEHPEAERIDHLYIEYEKPEEPLANSTSSFLKDVDWREKDDGHL